MDNATNPTDINNETWTAQEQEQFAVFMQRFPNESSEGMISLGSAWKHGKACAEAQAQTAAVLDQLRRKIAELREASYAAGDRQETAGCALDRVLNAIDEVQAKLPLTSQPAEDEEESAEDSWRRLAMQFDHHRMQALWHLRAMVSDPAKHAAAAAAFLSAPPLGGDEVLAQRIAVLAAGLVPTPADVESWAVRYARTRKQGSPDDHDKRFSAMQEEIDDWRATVRALAAALKATSGAQPGVVLSADECFVALSWLGVARKRINFGPADEALLAKLGAVCPNAAHDVERQADAEDERASAPAATTDDVRDAERWRAFVGSARIQPQGSAGLNSPMPNHYAHMGLEIWTTYDRDYSPELLAEMDEANALGRDWLTKYADVAVAARRAAMAAGSARTCNICARILDNPVDPVSRDCGGDCLACMAEAGDPEAVAAVAALPKAS